MGAAGRIKTVARAPEIADRRSAGAHCCQTSQGWLAVKVTLGLRATGPRSGGSTIVVVQHPTQALSALNCSAILLQRPILNDQVIFQTLMIAFAMIMVHKLTN